MSRSGHRAYSDQLELHQMNRHQEDDKRKKIFITAESYLDDVDLADFIAELRAGYESMGQINLALAKEAFYAENEVWDKSQSYQSDREDRL